MFKNKEAIKTSMVETINELKSFSFKRLFCDWRSWINVMVLLAVAFEGIFVESLVLLVETVAVALVMLIVFVILFGGNYQYHKNEH